MLDDPTMNPNDRQTREPEMFPAEPFDPGADARSSSLVVSGMSMAIVGAVAAVSGGMADTVIATLGLALLVAGTALAMIFTAPVSSRLAPSRAPSGERFDRD
jgi:hypothetical protein